MMAAGITSLHAQSNIIRNLNIALSANVQTSEGTSQLMRVGNKEILTAIGTDQGAISTKAKLLVSRPIEGEGFAILARTKGADDIDVTGFFSQTQIGTSVVSTKGNSETSIQEFTFHSTTLDFDVQGFTTSKTINIKNGGTSSTENASVGGTGNVSGNPGVFKGTVALATPKVE